MIKNIVRATVVAVAMTAVVGGTAAAQTQDVSMTVASTNTLSFSGTATVAPAAIAAGAASSTAQSVTKYSVSTNDTSARKITAYISAGVVPAGATLKVLFTATKTGHTAAEQTLNGVTTAAGAVTVLSGFKSESVTDANVTHTFIVTPTTPAGTTSLTVTYTIAPAV